MCKCYALNLYKILKFSCWFSKFCHSLTAQLHLDLQEIAKLPFCSSWSMSYAGDIQCILWRWGRFSYFNLIWCFCVSVQNLKKNEKCASSWELPGIHCKQRAVTTHYLATQLMIILLLLQCLPYTWNELQLVHIVFFFVNIIMWFCLFHASTTDPGFLPRNIPEYDLAIKQVSYRLFFAHI